MQGSISRHGHFGPSTEDFTGSRARALFSYFDHTTLQSRKIGGAWCAVFAEHPEDWGVIVREEDNKVFYPASIWQLEELRRLVDEESPLQLATIAICQCCFGAPYRKPTRLLRSSSGD